MLHNLTDSKLHPGYSCDLAVTYTPIRAIVMWINSKPDNA